MALWNPLVILFASMPSTVAILSALVVVVLLVVYSTLRKRGTKRYPTPPGEMPIVGHFLGVDTNKMIAQVEKVSCVCR